jgi:hypothetical protein
MTDYLTTGALQVITTPRLISNGRSLRKSIFVRSLPTNTETVYLVQPDHPYTEGYPLYPGDSIELPLADSWSFHLVTQTGTAEVRFIAF